MKYELSQVPDRALLDNLRAATARERHATADVLAHLAEVEARKLYLAAAYPSMHAYCVGELHYSEQAAYKRLRAARTARRLPVIYEAIADGRLTLSAVVLMTPYLSVVTVRELVAAATHKTSLEVETIIANRFPRLDVPTSVAPLRTTTPAQDSSARYVPCQLSSRTVGTAGGESSTQHQSPPLTEPSPAASVSPPADVAQAMSMPQPPLARARIEPIAPERFALTLTMRREMNDKLRYARELLGHQVPSGDIAEVLERGLDALIRQLEKTRFAATDRPRTEVPDTRGADSTGGSADPRHIAAAIKRAVWARDDGRCTFVSADGRRCESRTRLEFDHALEVARGGATTEDNLRLRCREHNQYAAERSFGAGFMEVKRRTA